MAQTKSGRSFKRTYQLLDIEQKVQKRWEEGLVFEAEAGERLSKKGEKFFGTFPTPYMNGHLHIGHGLSLSKLAFAITHHKMNGVNVVIPFGFHCTGMPIKASAVKLKREIERFGNPPVFPPSVVVSEPEVKPNEGSNHEKFKEKKSKVIGGERYQYEIMRGYGLSDDMIAEFQDYVKWLRYFSPLAVEVLNTFGMGVDWRRSFMTTDFNPYFDTFVRWHMKILKQSRKIVKDVRYTIYSPLDGQSCVDHDRASGEGVNPQVYTLIKMEVVNPFPAKFAHLEGRKVYLDSATLRPETMYGQTNCWVFPDGKYGGFEINEN